MTDVSLGVKTLVHFRQQFCKRDLKGLTLNANRGDCVLSDVAKTAAQKLFSVRNQSVEAHNRFQKYSFKCSEARAADIDVIHPNLTLLCVETGKVDAPVAAAKVGRSSRAANRIDASTLMFGTP